MNAIQTLQLTKIFSLGLFKKKKRAVDALSLEVPAGSIVGLMGHNGSGKSTTLKMILGFLKPTRGQVLTFEEKTPQLDKIGYLPENPRFPRFLTARSLMRFYAQLRCEKKTNLEGEINQLLQSVGLASAADRPISGFSKGMTQRLGIAQSLLGNPKLILLDEPMSGLDPLGRERVRTLISDIHKARPETTILFTSHVYQDVESLCDKVIVLKSGSLYYDGPTQQLPKQIFSEEVDL